MAVRFQGGFRGVGGGGATENFRAVTAPTDTEEGNKDTAASPPRKDAYWERRPLAGPRRARVVRAAIHLPCVNDAFFLVLCVR